MAATASVTIEKKISICFSHSTATPAATALKSFLCFPGRERWCLLWVPPHYWRTLLVLWLQQSGSDCCTVQCIGWQLYQNAKHIMCNLWVKIKSILFSVAHISNACHLSHISWYFLLTAGVEKSPCIISEYSKWEKLPQRVRFILCKCRTLLMFHLAPQIKFFYL